MKDGNVNGLFELAMRRIKEASATKEAFVGGPEIQQGLQAQAQAQDPAMAAQGGQPPMDPAMAAQGGQPPPQDPAAAAQGQPPLQAGQSPEAAGQPPPPQGVPPEVYDMVVGAVRQVLQEMGAPAPAEAAAPAAAPQAQPEQGAAPKGKGKGGKIDPDDFAKLQAVVAMLLEHLGLADMSGALQESTTPQEQPAGQEVQQEQAAQDTAGMGAHPGKAAELPEDAQPLGPLDPNGAQRMAEAGANGRRLAGRVGKLAALIRGDRA